MGEMYAPYKLMLTILLLNRKKLFLMQSNVELGVKINKSYISYEHSSPDLDVSGNHNKALGVWSFTHKVEIQVEYHCRIFTSLHKPHMPSPTWQ